MAKQPDWLWLEFSSLHSRWMSGKITREEYDKAWQAALDKAGVTREEFAARCSG